MRRFVKDIFRGYVRGMVYVTAGTGLIIWLVLLIRWLSR